MMRIQHRMILIAILSLCVLFLIGVIGYSIIEPEWSLSDALFMTVITLTTVGYDDLGMSHNARVFTILLILGGIGIFLFAVGTLTSFIIEGQLNRLLRRRRMDKTIEQLKDHYIVCGAGDTGIHVIEEFLKMGTPFVVIDMDSERMQRLLETRRFLYIHGDATHDETLIAAGIKHARGLVTALSADKDNLFVIVSARELNPDLRIVSKAVDETACQKLRRAGANDIVQPDYIGGLRIASVLLRPQVVQFLDMMLGEQEHTRFDEAIIQEGSELVGKTLAEAEIPKRTGLLVVALRRAGEQRFIYNPRRDLVLHASDVLVVIGEQKAIRKLHRFTDAR